MLASSLRIEVRNPVTTESSFALLHYLLNITLSQESGKQLPSYKTLQLRTCLVSGLNLTPDGLS